MKAPYYERVKFSGDSKINIKFFGIGQSSRMCSTCGSIYPQVIKPSFRAIQKNFAFGYLNMMLIYLIIFEYSIPNIFESPKNLAL